MRRNISSITSHLPQNLLLCNVGDPKSKINPALNKPQSASLITASSRSPTRLHVSARFKAEMKRGGTRAIVPDTPALVAAVSSSTGGRPPHLC